MITATPTRQIAEPTRSNPPYSARLRPKFAPDTLACDGTPETDEAVGSRNFKEAASRPRLAAIQLPRFVSP